MNANLPEDHASIQYYDSDYPGKETSLYPENFDDTTVIQGLAHDVERYLELASAARGPVLELCCGTGRVAIPLARNGFEVTAVDLSEAMLSQFRKNLEREEPAAAERVELVNADITRLDLGRVFPLILLPFNSLLCVPRFEDQCSALAAAARHLVPRGRVVIDAMNPTTLPLAGDPVPKPFFTRRNTHTGNLYTRFAALGPMGADQVQELFGWYDEIAADGIVRRTLYSMHWRPIFRYEMQLMVERAGLAIESVEGGHQKEPFTAQSRKMFVIARKPE
jgi:ubiquinone/menaquinone biosynthesis C-methylase UbiE